MKKKCKDDALKALVTLIEDFEKNLPPQQACELMKYCKKKEESTVNPVNFKALSQSSACNACKILFPWMHRMLQDEETRKQTKNIISKICSRSRKPEQCTQETSDFIDNLANEEDAALGCAALCKDNFMTASLFKVNECTVCQTTMVFIDQVFKNEKVRAKLNGTLENLCESRDGETQANCKSMVRKNLLKFYEQVNKLTDHDNGFCPTMGFCVAKKPDDEFVNFNNDDEDLLKGAADLLPDENELLNEPFLFDNQNVNAKSQMRCDSCKKIMAKVQSEVKDHKNLKDELLKRLIQTCPKEDDKCRQFYKKYINYFYDMLIRNTDPDRVCPLMKLCPEDFILNIPDERQLYEEEWQSKTDLTETTVCKECHSALDYLTNTLSNKTVVDFLMKELTENFCEPLGYLERKACKT